MQDEEIEDEELDSETDEEFEVPSRDITGVFDKIITPKSSDKEITRDLKLTKTDFNERMYMIRVKVMIELCEKYKLEKALIFYRALHNYYENILASDGGFTIQNLSSTRQYVRKEVEHINPKKKGFLR